MNNEIAQLVNAIKKLIKDDTETLVRNADNKEYLKGVLRKSSLEEKVVQLQIETMSKVVEGIEHEVAQGGVNLSECDEKWLKLSKNLLDEIKIDHRMEECY